MLNGLRTHFLVLGTVAAALAQQALALAPAYPVYPRVLVNDPPDKQCRKK